MEADLLQMFEDVGYTGTLLQNDALSQAIEFGPKSIEYVGIVAWFAEQIGTFIDIEETIHAINTPDDASSFLLELSCFLKEIGCVNKNLTSGNVNQRLTRKEDRTLLLQILTSELMACKILQLKNPKTNVTLEVTVNESDTAKHLKNMLIELKFQKPPDSITPQLLFAKLENKVKEIISHIPPELLGSPFFFGELSNDQWEKINELNEELQVEYMNRREMLLKRLDVTVQSFLWSDKVQSQEEQINTKYSLGRQQLSTAVNVGIADLIAARDDLAIIEKTSNAVVRKNTRSSINSIIIGTVPDRGGRPYEQEPPPPEMPPWQKDRVPGPPSFRGGGRGGSGTLTGRGGGGGGRGGSGYNSGGNYGGGRGTVGGNSGGYSSGGNYSNDGGYGSNRGSYVTNEGGGYSGGGERSSYSGGSNYNSRGSGSCGGHAHSSGGFNNYSGNGSNNYNEGGSNYSSRETSNYGGGGGGTSFGSNRGGYGGGRGGNRGGGSYGDRGGRVQGGWNQGANTRSGYNRGKGWGERQY